VIQPIASKHLLPYFGGSSSVWATSLVFFTTILFLGYAYVYVITSLRSSLQVAIHGIVVAVAAVISLVAITSWGSIYPPLDWLIVSSLSPVLRVLTALSVGIGIPYFLLSTTGPLLQYWYGITSERELYKLYALSNAGSLLALLSYPFLIEPNISLPSTEITWAVLFCLYAVLIVTVTSSVRNTHPNVRTTASTAGTYGQKAAWIAYASLPAFMLVSTTTVLTQLISPVPLLWVVPLAIYLITFILAFSGYGSTRFMPVYVFIAAASAYVYTPAHPLQIVSEVTAYLILLFFVCLLCHAQLYRRRPETSTLPFFYVCTSFGGMLGTMAATVLPPALFNDFYEFPFGLAVSASLAILLLPSELYPRIVSERVIRMIRFIAPFAFAALFSVTLLNATQTGVRSERNFYGAFQINFTEEATVLMNGTTMHGLQPTAKEWSYVPTSYYTANSGFGRSVRAVRESTTDKKIRTGIIGLGTGSAAIYCEPHDTFTFYEIDPDIERVARSYFTYLARCPGSSVRIGDGRLVLASEKNEERYDLFVVDAFTDDAIPAHLLTTEAVGLYTEKITDSGILAIHVSNRFLILYPMILSIARAHNLTAMVVFNPGDDGHLGAASQWVLLSKHPKIFEADAFIGVPQWSAPLPLPAPWTDNYTSLFSVLSVPLPKLGF
jgi:hypothetical protein